MAAKVSKYWCTRKSNIPVIGQSNLWNISDEYNSKKRSLAISGYYNRLINQSDQNKENIQLTFQIYILSIINKYINCEEHLKFVQQSSSSPQDVAYKFPTDLLDYEIEKVAGLKPSKVCSSSIINEHSIIYQWNFDVSHLDVFSIGIQESSHILTDVYQCKTRICLKKLKGIYRLPVFLQIGVRFWVNKHTMEINIPAINFEETHSVQCPSEFSYRLIINLYSTLNSIELTDFHAWPKK